MNEIFDRFMKERAPGLKKRTQADYGRHIVKLRTHFGEKLATEVTLDDLNAFMVVEKGLKGKIQRNRQMAVLSSALGAAVEWRWIDYNLAKEVQRHEQKKRGRVVTDKEIAGIRQKTRSPQMRCAIDLTRLTGLRQGQLTQLRWGQVHREQRVILARHHITDARIEVPITKEVEEALDRCRQLKVKTKSPFVIPTRTGRQYTSAGFRALWQRTINAWTLSGHDRFRFQDITMTALRENKRTSPPTQYEDHTVAGFAEFDAVLRTEATRMSEHYKVFYCLEKSIRELVATAMREAYGSDWWNSGNVNAEIQKAVDSTKSREIDSGMDQRSEEPIDYTTFGQLNQIISQNWDAVFIKKLRNKNNVGNVMTRLNRIRGPIAHFSLMTEHDVRRLEFTVADWFNQRVT